ncbi:hypothetical protein F5B20DRAFT_525306 [Whalleya microplaca]|nr:hypothetical protein F5B20DRAFT_525306 [Whalleya microplaca]
MRASIALFAAVSAFVNVAAADTPPACLLSALGVQPNPSDIKAVCGDFQSAVRGNLTSNCNKNILSDAYEAYADKCKDAGVTVADLTSSTSAGSSKTSSPSATGTGSGSGSASATATDGASATSGGSGTGAATVSSTQASPTDSAGQATGPQPFLYAAAALLATGLTSALFL